MIKMGYRLLSILLIVVIALTCIPGKSSAGLVWTSKTLAPIAQLNGVTFGGGKYVIVGTNAYVSYSTDGVNWVYLGNGVATAVINSVLYAGNQFMYVGEGGLIGNSTDGVNWVGVGGPANPNLKALSYNPVINSWVTAGPVSWQLETSRALAGPNNFLWTKAATVINYPNSIIYDGTSYVSVSAHATALVHTSTDGANWTQVGTATGTLNSIAYGGGLYVAVGASGGICTSPDKITWTARTSGTTQNLNYVTYGNGTFVAVGAAGTLLTSTDGINWASASTGTTQNLNAVTYGNSGWVAVGAGGTILTGAPSMLTPPGAASTFASVSLNVSSASTTGSTSFSVSDSRGTGAGWSTTLAITDLVSGSIADSSSGGSGTMTVRIPASSVSITSTSISLISGQAINPTYGPKGNNLTLSTTPQRIVNASPGYGMGNYSATVNFKIAIPASVIVNSLSGAGSKYKVGSVIGTRSTTYTSTFTYATSTGI